MATYPTLSWNAVNEAISYTLQVSSDSNFASYIYNKSGLTDRKNIINGLDTLSNYYWRVNATNSCGTSGWSIVWKFTTGHGTNAIIEWVAIPSGNFKMGSTNIDPYYEYDELPQHIVYLDAYQISKYEITNAQFKAFMNAGGYTNISYWTSEGWAWKVDCTITEPRYWTSGSYNSSISFPNHPVVGVSWYEAYAFCKWIGGRLPTEAEWEKASRGTDSSSYWPWGSTWDASKCNSANNVIPDTFTYSSQVGYFSIEQNAYEVYDMSGNIWEWVNDWYSSTYYSSSQTSNPTGPAIGSYRVLRGGCWFNDANLCRSVNRFFLYPVERFGSYGFRIVK